MKKDLPRLWRKKRGGRLVGSYHCTIKGKDVNLGTSDAEEAHRRRDEAMSRGRRRIFDDEVERAAASMDRDDGGGAVGAVAGGVPPPVTPVPPTAPPPFSPPLAPPLQPDAVLPPPRLELPPPPAAGDAEDMAAAAAEVAGDGAANDNAAGADEAPAFGPDVVEAFMEQAADGIVDIQLTLQAAAVRRATGHLPPPVTMDPKLRAIAAKAWVAQLKTWIPLDVELPMWALAMMLPALYVPAQVAGARAAAEAAKNQGKAAA